MVSAVRSILGWLRTPLRGRGPGPEEAAPVVVHRERGEDVLTGIPPAPADALGALTLGGTVAPPPKAPAAPSGPAEVLRWVVVPTLRTMAAEDGIAHDPRAVRMLLAICGQEAGWRHRDQVVTGKQPGVIGPATGLWQFERGGGVAGVLRHARTAELARKWCRRAGVAPDAQLVWRAMVHDDALACAFARLLLLTDPRPLPSEMWEGWAQYLWCWRPGKPHRTRWPACWAAAERAIADAEGKSPIR